MELAEPHLGEPLSNSQPSYRGNVGAALTEGENEGLALGDRLGAPLGNVVGSVVGAAEGAKLGTSLGEDEGCVEGADEGAELGTSLGKSDGSVEGASEGVELGTLLGKEDGASLGNCEGAEEGTDEGTEEGSGGATHTSPDANDTHSREPSQLPLEHFSPSVPGFPSLLGSKSSRRSTTLQESSASQPTSAHVRPGVVDVQIWMESRRVRFAPQVYVISPKSYFCLNIREEGMEEFW